MASRPPGDRRDWPRAVRPYLERIVATGRYPLFTRMLAEADDFPDADATFEWQLQRVLDGLAATLPKRRGRVR